MIGGSTNNVSDSVILASPVINNNTNNFAKAIILNKPLVFAPIAKALVAHCTISLLSKSATQQLITAISGWALIRWFPYPK